MGETDRRREHRSPDGPPEAPGLIVRPIAQLPSVYIEEPRPVVICQTASETFEWTIAVWDGEIGAWFCGGYREFMNWKHAPEEGEEHHYIVEPTHFFELPRLPARQGVH